MMEKGSSYPLFFKWHTKQIAIGVPVINLFLSKHQ